MRLPAIYYICGLLPLPTRQSLVQLVYIYLLKYTSTEPDLALLSINTFQCDLGNPNPLIRAMALRVDMFCASLVEIVVFFSRSRASCPSRFAHHNAQAPCEISWGFILTIFRVKSILLAPLCTLFPSLLTVFRQPHASQERQD